MSDNQSEESFSREMRKATRKIHKISDDLVNAKVVFGKFKLVENKFIF